MALAGRTGDRLRAGLGAGAVAGLAGYRGRHADLRRLALVEVFQRDLEIVAHVGDAIGAGASAAGTAAHDFAEQVVEAVANGGEVEAGADRSAGPGEPRVRTRGVMNSQTRHSLYQH